MRIDREKLVRRHNPVLTAIDTASPLSVGNGELAFTADITGMQTLYDCYEQAKMPLCTQSQWGWHTTPVSEELYAYERSELIETEYDFNGRKVTYPIECAEGNEAVYHWLRQNPHRLNLARIGLWYQGEEITPEKIQDIRQELDLYTGILNSYFTLDGAACMVQTACAPNQDTIAFSIKSEGLEKGLLSVVFAFPYGSPEISASDFSKPEAHQTKLKVTEDVFVFERTLDKDAYVCSVLADKNCVIREIVPHVYELIAEPTETLNLAVNFALPEKKSFLPSVLDIMEESRQSWLVYWTKTGVIQLHESKDKRAEELERRIILSQYLLAIQSSGSVPPQETGLTCNSWYGKFHLEMYFWHEGYLPLWGRTDMMEKSLAWFEEHLPQAKANAAKNGYAGARWPKMVGLSCIDAPSWIAPLLIWQQPHIIYMLHLGYLDKQDIGFAEKYYELVKESADFMADFAVKNEDGFYELLSPLIPVQECHPPRETKNPVFEVEYWVLGLKIAVQWAKMLGREVPQKWIEVSEHMIPSPIGEDGMYRAHSTCTETYGTYAVDHPSFLMAYGVIDTGRIDENAMERSLEKSLEVWDETSLWGWDFAVMAMTAVKLKRPEFAIELILKDTVKNVYVASGNNRQVSRDDLPLYLPGNGSLLLATAMMAAGYEGCDEECPGFPKDGNWSVQFEGIHRMPVCK